MRKKQEEVMREKLLAQEAKKQEKVSMGGHAGQLGWGGHGGDTCVPRLSPLRLPRSGTSGSSRS